MHQIIQVKLSPLSICLHCVWEAAISSKTVSVNNDNEHKTLLKQWLWEWFQQLHRCSVARLRKVQACNPIALCWQTVDRPFFHYLPLQCRVYPIPVLTYGSHIPACVFEHLLQTHHTPTATMPSAPTPAHPSLTSLSSHFASPQACLSRLSSYALPPIPPAHLILQPYRSSD